MSVPPQIVICRSCKSVQSIPRLVVASQTACPRCGKGPLKKLGNRKPVSPDEQ